MNAESLLPILLELLAKSALTACAAALLLRGWRGATAAQRHLVWFVALATVMMLPFTRLIAPFWKISLLPAKQARAVAAVRLPLHRATPVETEFFTSEQPVVARPAHRTLDWRSGVLGVWMGGAMLLLGYRLIGSWRLHRLRQRSSAVDDPRIRLLLSRTLSELGLPRRPEMRLSEECRVPITWGSFRPVMLLPRAALEWSDDWVLAALRHEGAHICRHDYLTRWFAHVACAFYWPNPLVWLLARALRVAQELAADDLVLRAGTPPVEYASQLVDAARTVTTHGFFVHQAVAMACPSTLEDRVRAIVDGRRDRRPLSRSAAACGSLAIALALGVSTAAQLRSDEEKPAATEPAPDPKTGAKGPEIEIAARFVEIATQKGKDEPPIPNEWFGQDFTVFSDPQFQVIIRALNQKKGVDLLAAPRITTKPNQPGRIEIVREFKYPVDWEKSGPKWKATKYETKDLGFTMEVDPRLTADGTLEIHEVATLVEFMGFVPLDGAAATPTPKKGVQENWSTYPPVPEGRRSKPVFSTRTSEETVKLKDGETVAIGNLPPRRDESANHKVISERKVLIFISPRLIKPAPKAGELISKEWKIPFDMIPMSAEESGPVSAREWLVSKGVEFEGAATAVYILRASRLVVRDTPEQITLIDQIVSEAAEEQSKAEKASGNPDGVTDEVFMRRRYLDFLGRVPTPEEVRAFLADSRPAAEKRKVLVERLTDQLQTGAGSGGISFTGGSAAREKAEKIVIPLLEFKELSFDDALDLLRKKALEADPEKIGVKIVVKPGTTTPDDARITVWLKTIPVIEGLRYVTGLAGLTFVTTPDALVVQPNEAGVAPAIPLPSPAADAGATNPLLARAEKIVIPKVELREVTVTEAIEFLSKQSVEIDPEKKGVKIILKPGTVSNARLTMSLTNVPLIEALKYVTSLASLEYMATPDALVVQPGAGETPPPKDGA